MRILYFLPILLFLLVSCGQQKKIDTKPVAVNLDSVLDQGSPVFFPVTNYIKGQVYEIINKGINPLKIVSGPRPDSTWVKIETLNEAIADFLTPVIDTANMLTLFTEKKFMDQTLDAITLTYDPVKNLPDSFALQHWDVYIDPNTNSVKRIYMVKKISPKKTLQLTWQSNKWCKMVTIAEDASGNSFVEREVNIKWDF